jgi:hypothetical protein
MGLTIELIGEGVTAAAEWRSFTYAENIGTPDSLSVDVVGFKTDPLFTEPVEERLANPNNYFYIVARLDDDVLFSGLVRDIGLKKPAQGAMRYSLAADGWQFLLPRRLVGVPNGDQWYISAEQAATGELPEPECVDPVARFYLGPTPGGVRSLFGQYWNYPYPIDLTTYVTDILPEGASGDEMNWSGSDMEAVLNDLAAAGSASAMWWFANDSPGPAAIGSIAPNLALHFGIVIIPDEGDDGDDLAAGLPSADLPGNIAPLEISDDPDGVTSILATDLSFRIDHRPRTNGVYVRGATGFVLDVLEAPPDWPVPYQIGETHIGGTGWGGGGAPGGIWGEEYLDAPAAVSMEQRDAFANAYLASRAVPSWTGTVTVVGVDGWHKGQAIALTDADYGFDHKWFLIRGVSMTQKDHLSTANEYVLTLGDVLSPSLGWALREQRLKEQRKEVDPGAKFVVYHGDLLLDPADPDNSTSKVEGQFATASGTARKVAGVGATWHLWINGVSVALHDTGLAYYLSDETTPTDQLGKVYAILHAGASATAADAADISIDVVLP